MKLAKIIAAAGLTVAAVTMSTSASAQDWRHDRGYHHGWDRGHHRGWDNHRGWDRGYGWNRHARWNRYHRVCRTEWHHHHPVRVCYR